MSEFVPKETIYKVDCAPSALTDQIVIRIGPQSVAVPAYRRDDEDFEVVTYLKSITFDPVNGGMEMRYLSTEGQG